MENGDVGTWSISRFTEDSNVNLKWSLCLTKYLSMITHPALRLKMWSCTSTP